MDELCKKINSLKYPESVDIYNIIINYYKKTSANVRKFGNKVTIPYGGELSGEDYTFNTNNIPTELIKEIEEYLNKNS